MGALYNFEQYTMLSLFVWYSELAFVRGKKCRGGLCALRPASEPGTLRSLHLHITRNPNRLMACAKEDEYLYSICHLV